MLDISAVLDGRCEQLLIERSLDLSGISIYGEQPFRTPVKLSLKLFNRASVCTLLAEYTCTLVRCCAKCLCESSVNFSYSVKHTVVRELTREREGILEAPAGVLDEELMATDDLLEQLSMRYLCSEACRGLCPGCGANLNFEVCRCT